MSHSIHGITVPPNTTRTPTAFTAQLQERTEDHKLSRTAGLTENKYRNRTSINKNDNNNNNNSINTTVYCCGAVKGVDEQNGHKKDVLSLEAEVHRLKAENEKLRVVEEQFWALLRENESLKTAHAAEEKRTPTTTTTTIISNSNSNSRRRRGIIKEKMEEGEVNDREEEDAWRRSSCVRALRECMDLLLSRELRDEVPGSCDDVRQQQLQRGDSVATYLLWLRAKQRREQPHTHTIDINRNTSKHTNGDDEEILPSLTTLPQKQEREKEEKEGMEYKLAIMENELRETREMLELTNASRVAALEDTARMSAQVSTLKAHLQQLLNTNMPNPRNVEMLRSENDELLRTVEKQSRDIMLRDQLLADMRVTLQQMRDARSAAEVSLAEEVKRAREGLLLRRGTTSFGSVAGTSAPC
ncbi:uncharacterized protein TM35_000171540 [Trypanosoma theileri]|uniref:Uncharacterized protein n=1 Tax=Trypanosoma theileri TaxID=67003 RepID=A0A1X0NUC7_9TRYP|nr:uncharacterized protein TM35_000171540 [Trypanosoma theileri]ORC88282.1 hypothetical protein TM35_000171540 [Trypanosoma theileri]